MNTLQRYNLGVDKDAALRYSKSIGKIPESGERDVWSFSQCTDGMHRKCGRTGFKTRNPDEGDGRAVIGTLLDIDRQLNRLAAWVEARFKRKNDQVTLAEGFVAASLLFCVGAMTIVGSLQAGLTGDCEMLYTKAALDLISSCVLAASLGFGVLLAGVFVLVFQGGLVLLAGFVAPFLTDYAIGEMTCAGSVLIIALGLNIIGITKIKVADYLPVILIPPLLCLFM